MAMKLENISNGKIIGIGEVTVLPGETKDIPEAYETSPILEVYKRNGFAKITGKPKSVEKSEAEKAAAEADAAKKAAEDAEALRQARLADQTERGYEPRVKPRRALFYKVFRGFHHVIIHINMVLFFIIYNFVNDTFKG